MSDSSRRLHARSSKANRNPRARCDEDYARDLKEWIRWHTEQRDRKEWSAAHSEKFARPITLEEIELTKRDLDVIALPRLFERAYELDEDGLLSEAAMEARDAICKIISHNPGNEDVLALIPKLLRVACAPETMFSGLLFLSAISHKNPKECKVHTEYLLELGEILLEAEPNYEVLFSLQELAIIFGNLGDSSFLPVLGKIRSKLSIDWEGSELDYVDEAIRKIQAS